MQPLIESHFFIVTLAGKSNLAAMKNAQSIGQSLLSYLTEKGIQFSYVMSDDMKDKAVVKFSHDLGIAPASFMARFKIKERRSSPLPMNRDM
ncbi:MAG: hypothetical protein QGG48_02000 [Desulfatiglandales bacterium]|jgi:hypothetical protein|nr:hypothetical protein [Desulfatiglandales bacterium]